MAFFQPGKEVGQVTRLPSKAELLAPDIAQQTAMKQIASQERIANQQMNNQRAMQNQELAATQQQNQALSDYRQRTLDLQAQQENRLLQQQIQEAEQDRLKLSLAENEKLRQIQLGKQIAQGFNSGDLNSAVKAAYEIDPQIGVGVVNAMSAVKTAQAQLDEQAQQILPILLSNIRDQQSLDFNRKSLADRGLQLPEKYEDAKTVISGAMAMTNPETVKQEAMAAAEGRKESLKNIQTNLNKQLSIKAIYEAGKALNERGLMGQGFLVGGIKRGIESAVGGENAALMNDMSAQLTPLVIEVLQPLTGPKTDFEFRKAEASLPNVKMEWPAFERLVGYMNKKIELSNRYEDIKAQYYARGMTTGIETTKEYQDFEQEYRNFYKELDNFIQTNTDPEGVNKPKKEDLQSQLNAINAEIARRKGVR